MPGWRQRLGCQGCACRLQRGLQQGSQQGLQQGWQRGSQPGLMQGPPSASSKPLALLFAHLVASDIMPELGLCCACLSTAYQTEANLARAAQVHIAEPHTPEGCLDKFKCCCPVSSPLCCCALAAGLHTSTNDELRQPRQHSSCHGGHAPVLRAEQGCQQCVCCAADGACKWSKEARQQGGRRQATYQPSSRLPADHQLVARLLNRARLNTRQRCRRSAQALIQTASPATQLLQCSATHSCDILQRWTWTYPHLLCRGPGPLLLQVP